MQVRFTFRNTAASDNIREYALHRMARLSKYLDTGAEIDAVFSSVRSTRTFELVFAAPGTPFTIRETALEMRAAIDLAIDKAERQLVRRKERRAER
jgi:putative sigma-54 modulation protein